MENSLRVLNRENVIDAVVSVSIAVIAMAIASRVVIHLSFTPIPITLQVLVVIGSGLILGSKRALAAQIVCLTLILAGVPLTAYGLAGPAMFLSPTAGYLLAFPLAAYMVGAYSEKFSGWFHSMIAGITGIFVIYLSGTAWLSIYLHDFIKAFQLGVVPFLIIDCISVRNSCKFPGIATLMY